MVFTSLSSWCLLIATTLTESGYDSARLFREAGLDPKKLSIADARYPVDRLQYLWTLARDVTANPSFGVDVVRHWHPTTMHALGYAWMASESLIDAMKRAVRYAHVVSTDIQFQITTAGDSVEFSLRYDRRRPPPIDIEIDALLAVFVHMCRATSNESAQPLHVATTRPASKDAAAHERFFQCPVRFGADHNTFALRKEDATRRLLTANVELALASDKLALDYLNQINPNHYWSRHVRDQLLKLLPERWATQRAVAEQLGMSPRVLQRRLAKEGTSYQGVLDEVRSELALEYLRTGTGIQQIAFLLGFSDASAFTKAFRRWFRTAPGDYRRRNNAAPFSGTP